MNFIPDQDQIEIQIPYLDDARSDEGWQGHTTKESLTKLKSQIYSEITLLGGTVTRFIRGTYQINNKSRPGVQLIYEIIGPDGLVFKGKIDIAGLPWRAPYGGKKHHGGYAKVEKNKRDLSLRMALYNVREALRAMRILQMLSPGYAERMARQLAGRYGYQEYPYHFDVTLHPDKLNQPFKWKKPRRIFVCSMGDLFHEDVPDNFINSMLNVMLRNKQHIYQVLTKRPQRMRTFIRMQESYFLHTHDCLFRDMFRNLWLGVTTENQKTADERIPILLSTPAAVRFVSVEPMLEQIDLLQAQGLSKYVSGGGCSNLPLRMGVESNGLDWIINGGETGHGAREMKAEWAWNLYNQCKAADVPFFFKKPGDAFQGGDLPTVREYPKKSGDE